MGRQHQLPRDPDPVSFSSDQRIIGPDISLILLPLVVSRALLDLGMLE
jgi:hypothetical protein